MVAEAGTQGDFTVQLTWQSGRQRADITVQPGQIRLSVDRLNIMEWDAEGRLQKAILGPDTYRRSYSDTYIDIVSEAVEGERFHVPRPMEEGEVQDMLERIRRMVSAVLDGAGPSRKALERTLRWNREQLAADGRRFRGIYQNPSPLPPDQQWSLILQPASDVAGHIEQVRQFLGEAWRHRQSSVYIDAVATTNELRRWLPVIVETIHPRQIGVRMESIPVEPLPGLTHVYVPLYGVVVGDMLQARDLGLRVRVLVDHPLRAEDIPRLAHRIQPLPLLNDDTVYLLEPNPYPDEISERLRLRKLFHQLRKQLPPGPTVSHFPTSQSVL